jgi:hypothetical protein
MFKVRTNYCTFLLFCGLTFQVSQHMWVVLHFVCLATWVSHFSLASPNYFYFDKDVLKL